MSEGVAECQRLACKPATWACDDAREQAELCSEDGGEVVRRVSCTTDGLVCNEGECVAKICEPETKRCHGDAIATCDAFGSGEDTVACPDGERCEPTSTTCVPRVCEPGAGGCLEETQATCDPLGSAYEVTGDDCAASQLACWKGACAPVLCDGGFSCINGASYECTANRTALTLAETCTFANGQFCNPESGQCQEFVCAPGQPTCNDDLATSCANDGSHPLNFGIDCTATNKVCWAAECSPPICEPGTYACNGAELQRCVHKGTAFERSKVCGEGTVCDALAGTCRLQKCLPNEPACDGSRATTCDESGLGYTGGSTDCAVGGNVCVEGACVPIICEPSSLYCQDNQVRACGPNGGSFRVIQTCLQAEFCNGRLGVCVPDICAPGAAVCTGNVLGTCKVDGSGPEPGGTDCGSQVCDTGACRPLICAPNTRFCEGGDVALCNALGTDFAPYDNCRPREFCNPTPAGAATCAPDICPQSANACSVEHLAACNADGSGLTTVGVDCSASAQVCDLTGACVANALDDLGQGGAAMPFTSSAIHFNLFHVSTPRKLVELEAASEPGSSPVTWIIYRSETELGTFSRISQFTTPTSSSSGYTSSGTISVGLDSGAYYLIGFAVTGAHDISVRETASPAPTSFGVWLGGFSYTAGLPPTIPDQVNVGPGLVSDDLALRIQSALP